MNKLFESDHVGPTLRERIIGLGETSIRKNHYPQLRQHVDALEKSRKHLEEKSAALMQMLADLEEARKKLAESQAQYRSLVENISDVIFSLDVHGIITYISPVIESLSGFKPEEIVGKPISESIQLEPQLTGMPGSEERQISQELKMKDKQGSWHYVRATTRPLVHEGEIVGVTGLLCDMTGARRLQIRERMRARVHEKLIRGDPLPEVLHSIILGIEEENRKMLGSILLLDREGKHLQYGAAPSLPRFFNEGIDGAEIGEEVCSWGAAACTGKRVIVPDICNDGRCSKYKDLAAKAGLVSSWSEPIVNRQGRVIGTFVIYYREPSVPSEDDINLIQTLANLAGVAIEHHHTESELRALNTELEQRVDQRTRELAASETRFRSIYETAPVSIWRENWTEVMQRIAALRAQGIADFGSYFRQHPELVLDLLKRVRILDVNEWTLKVFEASNKADMLKSLETVFAQADTLTGFIGELEALARGQPVYRTEMALNTAKGRKIHGLLSMAFPESDTSEVLVSVIDITDRMEAEQEIRILNRALEERALALEQSNQELESFSYSVAHDLRAPLRGIDGFSHVLLDDYADQLEEGAKRTLRSICASSRRMSEIINDLLAFSHVTRSEMHLGSVDLSGLAMGIADDLRESDPKRSIEFMIQPGLWAHADARLMRIALENLLGNAWKYTSKQSASKIGFGQVMYNGEPAYRVYDNGAGFDMAYIDRLFRPFQRLHNSSEFPGTGIGLATVQRIIQRHGGHIWAESKIGQGAVFYFTIPAGR